jgi:hypothetical protein
MRIAYLTLDEVNSDLAARCAAAADIELESFALCEAPEPFDAVVYDLDFLPADYRAGLLAASTTARSSALIAVHAYNLTSGQRRRLRRRGVVVARRLSLALFARLAAAAESSLV